MERKEIITNLSHATKVLSKVIKSNSLTADLELEVCNLRYDLLALISKLLTPISPEEEYQDL